MKTANWVLAGAMALGAMGAKGQVAAGPAYSPPLNPDYNLVGSVSIPYAFNWNAVGVSGELGGVWGGHHFVGGEVSYYGGDNERYNVYSNGGYVGSFRSAQDVTTVDFAYRYFAPIWQNGPYSKLCFYLGGGGGVAFVDYTNSGGAFGFHTDNDAGNLTGEALAGLTYDVAPGVGLRLGMRYLVVNDVWYFYHHTNLDTGAVEGGISFKF